jgi:hypothetical protein
MPVEEYLQELRLQYNNELDLRKNLDDKASKMITTAGTVTSLLFGFGVFIITRLGLESLANVATYFLIAAVLANIASIFLSLMALRLTKYAYVMTYDNFFTNDDYTKQQIQESENYNEKEIEDYKRKDLTEFKDEMIHDYLKCNRHNALKNESKVTKIKYSHYLFLGGVALIGILLLIILYPVALKAISSWLNFRL